MIAQVNMDTTETVGFRCLDRKCRARTGVWTRVICVLLPELD